jgi:hypothetical protein
MRFKERAQVLAHLETALEIPSLDYVYWVRNAENPRCVIAGWGFVKEGLLPEEHLLRNYTAYKVSQLRFSFSYEGEDNSPATGETVYFEWDKEQPRKMVTDPAGKVFLKGVPFYTLQRNPKTEEFEESRPNPIIKIFQMWQDNQKAHETEVQSGCFGEYHVKIKRPYLRATFQLRNKEKRGEILSNFLVAIYTKDDIWYKTSNSNGVITLEDLPPKTELRILSEQEGISPEEAFCLIDFEQTRQDLYFSLPVSKPVVASVLETIAEDIPEAGKPHRKKPKHYFWWWLLLLPLLMLIWWKGCSKSPVLAPVPQEEQKEEKKEVLEQPKEAPKNMPSEKIVPCNEQSQSGGAGITENVHELGSKKGDVLIAYDMDSVPDRILVFCEGEKLYDSKVPISGKGSFVVRPSSSKIKVVIEGLPNTAWQYLVHCPK